MHPQSICWKAVLTIPHLSYRVIEHGELNRMSVQNMAIVFGPTLLRPQEESNITMHMVFQNQIVELVLNEFKELFKTKWYHPMERKTMHPSAPSSQMNKVTDCFLITDWILAVPVNQSQNITTNNFIEKHEEDLRLETAWFFNAVWVLVLLKSREQKATDMIKQIL